jgi:thiamine biosynthesis lipoprotein
LFFYQSVKNYSINKKVFNVNINYFINIWGFNSKNEPIKTPLLEILCKYLKKNIFFTSIDINYSVINKIFHNVEITISASAKGYAVDQLYKKTKTLGFSNILAEIGGELKSSGLNRYNKLWAVGLLEPKRNNLFGQFIKLVYLCNNALASSGIYLNNIKIREFNFTHIINVKSGTSINTILKNISIFSPSCIIADILGTTSVIQNRNRTIFCLKNKKFRVFYLYSDFYNTKRYFIRTIDYSL